MSSAMQTTKRLLICGTALLALLLLSGVASAQASPSWRVDSLSNSTAQPGALFDYEVQIANTGDEGTSGPLVVTGVLPTGLTVAEPEKAILTASFSGEEVPCTQADGLTPLAGGESEVRCEFTGSVPDAVSSGGISNLKLFLVAELSGLAVAGETLTAHFSAEGGGAESVSAVDPTLVSATVPPFGIDAFDGLAAGDDGTLFTQAAGHPGSITTHIDFNTYTDPAPARGDFFPVEAVRGTVVDLPPGLVGNPTAAERCTAAQLANSVGQGEMPLCPPASQVGTTTVRFHGIIFPDSRRVALYNMVTPPGVPARFGFQFLGNPVVLDASVGTDQRLVVSSTNISQALAIAGVSVTFWGTPAAASHKPERSCPGETPALGGGPTCAGASEEAPFLRMPTACTAEGEGMTWDLHADSWEKTGARNASGEPDLSDPNWKAASFVSHEAPGYPASPADPSTPWGAPKGTEGCSKVHFNPHLEVAPTTQAADSPSGLDLDLEIPQDCWDHPEEICQSDLERAEIKLPKGMTLNPSAASGLAACTEAEIGLLGTEFTSAPAIRFDTQKANCPDASKLGEVTIETPLLEAPLSGDVYLAKQGENPFGSLLAMYLVAEGSGVTIKLAGEIEAGADGRLTTTFSEAPQLPFSNLHVSLFGGSRAALRTPPTCGTYAIVGKLTPWSGNAPVTVGSGFEIESCPTGGFNPKLAAGTQNPLAATTSPFNLRLTREDGEGELGGLAVTLPEGLTGYLKGIPYCPEAALASISGELGTGAGQEASPTCPVQSQLGRVTVGAGAGPNPFYTQSGRVYLAGPYKGAPLSLAVVAPAVAGPFDLGSVVVRNALQINPETAQITAVSDPLPTVLHGIPLDLRDVRVELNRDHFTLNPTSCDEMQVTSTVTSTAGASASPSNRFQVGGCDKLAFGPKLSFRLNGKTHRGANPGLRAVLTMPQKAANANISRVQVSLPHSEFLAQEHLADVCTRVQYAAGGGGGAGCPARSVYGHAVAYSPLLDAPLAGPVYLRSNGGERELPDLVASLGGQIHVDLVGYVDTNRKTGGLRTTFATAPDAPVQKFVLRMPAGRHSLLKNSTNICRGTHRAIVQMDAHNGKIADSRVKLRVAGCGGSSKNGRAR